MKLISSLEVLSFLSKVAPRPWVKRMLMWMIYNDEVHPYFLRGKIQGRVRVAEYLLGFLDSPGVVETSPETDEKIRNEYPKEVAEKLVGRDWMDIVDELSVSWDEAEDPHRVSAGFFVYASEIDWEKGTLRTDFIPEPRDRESHLFWDEEEHLPSEFEHPDFEVELSGLCFEHESIEMLLPNEELISGHVHVLVPHSSSKALGRPRKWDWDGALAFIAAKANHPDGLPTGPGAQARIEDLLSDRFVQQTGEAPAISQIRQRAQKVVHYISKE